MELNNFARIGKGVLTKAIGLQKNYVEIYEEAEAKLNENKSGCMTCPIYELKRRMKDTGIENAYDELHERCKECSSSVWDTTYSVSRKYINEKNRYGYNPTLKTTAIKLFLTYHFLCPDPLGFIKNISLKELSVLLGCTIATIKANNKILSSYGYCYFCNSGIYDNHINIMLPEYKNYHKPAYEGGRGYLDVSKELLIKLLSIESLNTLRLNIKGILEVDNASISYTQEQNMATVASPYKKLRGFLPSYCKRNVIRDALKKNNSIFDLTFNDSSVVFKIKSPFARKNIRESFYKKAYEEIDTYIYHFNTVLHNVEENNLVDEDTDALLHMFHIDSLSKYPPLTVTEKDLKDLSSMCVQYNSILVKKAISSIYNRYIARSIKIENFGALVRTFIRHSYHIFEIAS